MTRTRRLVAIGTAAAMAVAAVITYLALRSGGGGPPTAAATSKWPRFASLVSFRYPPTWHEHPWISAGSMGNSTLVYLSNRALVQPCHHWWNAAHTEVSARCDEFATTHLDAGDIAVTWSEHGFFGHGDPLRLMPGTNTRINGHHARIAVTDATVWCRRIDGQTSIQATIVPSPLRDELYAMDACIAAGPTSNQVTQVLASLHTYH